MTVGTFFDGTNDEIVLSSNDFTMTSTFSVFGMVYINTMTVQRYAIAAMNGATPAVAVRFDSGSLVIDSGADSPPWSSSVSPTTWYFFCITKGAGTVAPKAYLTSDGTNWTLDATNASVGTLSNLASGVISDFRIGSVLSSNFWNGDIAALGITNTELSQATAKSLINYSNWAGLGSALQFNSAESMINGGTVDDTSSVNNDEASRVGATTGVQTIPAWFTNFGGGPVPPTPITMQQVGTRSAGGTTSLTIAYPVTSLAAGDLFLCGRVVKPSTATVTTPPSPFTALANTTGGTGTQGIDTGPQRLSTEYLISPSGAESGNLTTAQAGTPDSAHGCMIRFRKPNGTYWSPPVVTTADDNSHGTARSAAGSAIDVQPGDMLCAYFASDTDTTTAYTSATFTGTGLSTGTVTIDLGAGGVGTGQDSGLMITHALVTAAVGSTAVTATLAGGPSSCGPIHIIRLRAIYPVHYGREPRLARVGSIVPIMARKRR